MKEQKLTKEEFEKVQDLKKDLPEWKAVCIVLGISEETNFVTRSVGSSSTPDEGIVIVFF